MLSTIDAGQIPVFAQNSISTLNNPPITPASKRWDGDDGSSSSNGNNNENDVSNDESAGSIGLTMMAVTMKATPKNDHQARKAKQEMIQSKQIHYWGK